MRILGRTVAVVGVLTVTACALVSGGVVPVDSVPSVEVETLHDVPADVVLPPPEQLVGLARGGVVRDGPG